jgi:pantoate--beta-alanine ligase
MIIFKKANLLSEYLERQHGGGKTIGFVPTMGALHEGHLSLVRGARAVNDIVACSIFVNPTQFNNAQDFQHYPNTIEKDIELLTAAGCDLLFLPPVSEIYPPGYQKKTYDLGALEARLEGRFRPGHFQGVCEVVDRLLNIVSPNNLYLGQKDMQQCLVIKRLVHLLGKEEQIHVTIVPTQREDSGLAMSSRNLRLNEKERELAAAISAELKNIKENLQERPVAELEKIAIKNLSDRGFVVDYVTVAQADDLSPADDTQHPLVALAAASLGAVRLIDNLPLN